MAGMRDKYFAAVRALKARHLIVMKKQIFDLLLQRAQVSPDGCFRRDCSETRTVWQLIGHGPAVGASFRSVIMIPPLRSISLACSVCEVALLFATGTRSGPVVLTCLGTRFEALAIALAIERSRYRPRVLGAGDRPRSGPI